MGVQHLCQRALCRRLMDIDEAQEVPCGSLLWLPILLRLKRPEQQKIGSCLRCNVSTPDQHAYFAACPWGMRSGMFSPALVYCCSAVK